MLKFYQTNQKKTMPRLATAILAALGVLLAKTYRDQLCQMQRRDQTGLTVHFLESADDLILLETLSKSVCIEVSFQKSDGKVSKAFLFSANDFISSLDIVLKL